MKYTRPVRNWRIGPEIHTLGERTWVMAVLNLTPDSFYPDSRLATTEAAVAQAKAALVAGADILDLGAESTRPGAAALSSDAEQARLLPALEAIRRACGGALLSADTRHAATAARALEAGADIINDVSGLGDAGMPDVLAGSGCGVILMHHRGEFATMQDLPQLADPLGTVATGLADLRERAVAAGIAAERLVLDPGFGFGKNLDENYPVLRGLDALHDLGLPLLVGISRKSFLGHSLAAAGGARRAVDGRLFGGLAAATAAVLAGAHLVRTHDVGATRDAVRIADRLLEAGEGESVRK